MGADGLMEVEVRGTASNPRVAWAEGRRMKIPFELGREITVEAAPPRRRVLDVARLDRRVEPEWAGRLRSTSAFTERKPLSSRLPFSYKRVPPVLRDLVAGFMGKRLRNRPDRWADFPAWPLDLSVDVLCDLSGGGGAFSIVGEATPVVLTHDLDSPEGLRNAVGRFLDLEEAVGARSTNFVVPCAWTIDHGLLGEIQRRGHELGIHGYDHSNRTPFAPAEERRKRIDAARSLIDRYGVRGYRAPSLLRTPGLMEDLGRCYVYDSSIPTSGGPFPTPNNGCAGARPFRIGGLIELPLSLPRDGSLIFMGYGPSEVFDLWRSCAEEIAASGGVVVLLTHCESRFSGSAGMQEVYRRFVEYVAASGRYVWRTASEVVQQASAFLGR